MSLPWMETSNGCTHEIFDIEQPVDLPVGEKILWQLADENLPKGHAGDYNQALMDLGADDLRRQRIRAV